MLLKTAEFALKDTETNDDSAVISSGKEQNPAETSSRQTTNSAAGGLLTSYKQAYISNPLICEQVGDPGRNTALKSRYLPISITTAPPSVSASHGSISLRHKISHPLSFFPQQSVPWQSARQLERLRHLNKCMAVIDNGRCSKWVRRRRGARATRHTAGLRGSWFSGDEARCCSSRKDALSSEVLPKITRVSKR